MPSCISSSFDLFNTMKKIKINPLKEKIFNADANSMYTNIDTNHALQVFKPFFIHHPLCHDIRSTATSPSPVLTTESSVVSELTNE